MIEKLIAFSARNAFIVILLIVGIVGAGTWALRSTPIDAIPDLSENQVIVFTDWMGRSPKEIEDQITYPLVRTLQSTPGVVTVRGYSMFGMSFTYALFGDGTDIYWARTRVLEQLGRVQLFHRDLPAICSAIGASYAGALGTTSTSGPGVALKTEAIGLAVMLGGGGQWPIPRPAPHSCRRPPAPASIPAP